MVRSLGCILTILAWTDADAPDLKTVTLHIPSRFLPIRLPSCSPMPSERARMTVGLTVDRRFGMHSD